MNDFADDMIVQIGVRCQQKRSWLNRDVLRLAARALDQLQKKYRFANETIHLLQRERDGLKSDVSRARAHGKKLTARIDVALEEYWASQRTSRDRIDPAAIVISPYQNEQLRWTGGPFKRKGREDLPSIKTYNSIPVYVAKGVHGPVVMTEDGFNAFSRQAPELMLTTAR